MAYALDGIRVLDLAQHTAGPTVSMYLGDQGAEVIKVEPWPKGDSSRGSGTNDFLKENSRSFMVLNRNKRSITVDIRKPQGRDIILKLTEQADVMVANFRPGAAERLGIGYDTLSAINPRLVYASVTAYGTKGPHSNKGGYDRILQGLAGVMYRRMPDGTPITAGLYAADSSTPMMMAYGIMLALWAREKTGVGQKVEASLLQTWIALQHTQMMQVESDPDSDSERADISFGVYECSDGQWINIAPNNDHQFARACGVLDMDYMLEDPRIDDQAQRPQLRSEMGVRAKTLLKTGTAEDWLSRFHEADIPCGPVLSQAQVFDEPQIVANDMFTVIEHPKAGRTKMVSVPIRLSATPGAIRKPAPLLSEHTAEILSELGYSSEQITNLKALDVV